MLMLLLFGVICGIIIAWTWFPGEGPHWFQGLRDLLRDLPRRLGLR